MNEKSNCATPLAFSATGTSTGRKLPCAGMWKMTLPVGGGARVRVNERKGIDRRRRSAARPRASPPVAVVDTRRFGIRREEEREEHSVERQVPKELEPTEQRQRDREQQRPHRHDRTRELP